MPHILVAYKQFPGPGVGHAGGESLFRVLEALRARGYVLSLVSRIREVERAQLPAVEAVCRTVITVPHHRDLAGPPFLAVMHSYLLFRRALCRALRELQPDLLHVETTQTATIALGLRRPPASFRTQDVNWFLVEQERDRAQKGRRLGLTVLRLLVKRIEIDLLRRHQMVVAISEGDRRLLAPYIPESQLLMVPLAPSIQGSHGQADLPDSGPIILFVGAMGRRYNQEGVRWFLDVVWPSISAAEPEAKFVVVGSHPPEWLLLRGDDEHVIVKGFVEDLAPWYRSARVFVSPLLTAGGLLQKIMDAMVMEVPVVATSVCNHGIAATPGVHLLTADTGVDFAGAVIKLLKDKEERQRLTREAHRFILTYYDFEAAMDRWDVALRRLLDGSKRKSTG